MLLIQMAFSGDFQLSETFTSFTLRFYHLQKAKYCKSAAEETQGEIKIPRDSCSSHLWEGAETNPSRGLWVTTWRSFLTPIYLERA